LAINNFFINIAEGSESRISTRSFSQL